MTAVSHITKQTCTGLLLSLCCFWTTATFSQEPDLDECFDRAGRLFDVNPTLLKAIGYTESRLKQDAINQNFKDGKLVSTDYGVMQINDSWFPRLMEHDITPEMVKTDTCINIEVGAWILAGNLATTSDGWFAVGAYNAGYRDTERHNAIRKHYAGLVKQNLEIISSWQK